MFCVTFRQQCSVNTGACAQSAEGNLDWHNRDIVMTNLARLYVNTGNWAAAKVCCHMRPVLREGDSCRG